MNVLVYAGDGVSQTSLQHTVASLRRLLLHRYDVISVHARTLSCEPWSEKCALLVIPGGRDLPYVEHLAGAANEKIRSYVEGGGSYLGICAGAYYASRTVDFERNTSNEVYGERQLGFFEGKCLGCIFPGFEYNSERGARATAVELNRSAWETSNGKNRPRNANDLPRLMNLYYNGGGSFVDANAVPGTTVLAWYAENNDDAPSKEQPRRPAIIECSVGSKGGIGILTGVHPEYIASQLDPNDPAYVKDGVNVVDILLDAEPTRDLLFQIMLSRLGLCPSTEEMPLQCTPLYLYSQDPSAFATILSTWSSQLEPDTGVLKDCADDFRFIGSGEQPVTNEAEKEKTMIIQPEGTPPPSTVTPYFNGQKYFKHLSAYQKRHSNFVTEPLNFGLVMCYAHVIGSTQTIIEKNTKFSDALPDGFVCLATRQVNGKGRGGNSWISPMGCLQFSTLFRHSAQAVGSVVFVQYLAALAVVQAVKERKGYEDIPIFLKWPNDIYALNPGYKDNEGNIGAKYVKIGGVLVNSSYLKNNFTLVVGCGVNLDNAEPTTSINALIARHNAEKGSRLAAIEVEDMVSATLCKLETYHRCLLSSGFAFPALENMDGSRCSLMDLYLRRWLHSNERITLLTQNPSVQAMITGITPDYGLLKCVAADGTGREFTLQPDGNSFDMMKGLISAKRTLNA